MLNYCECVICRGPLTGVSSCKYRVTHTEYHCFIPAWPLSVMWSIHAVKWFYDTAPPRQSLILGTGGTPHSDTQQCFMLWPCSAGWPQKWTVYFPQLWSVIRGWYRVNWHWPLESIKGHRNRAISTYYILPVPSGGNQLKVTQILMHSNHTDRRNDEHQVTSSCIHFLFFPAFLLNLLILQECL